MMWFIYALLSAIFAALTAIFTKIGTSNVNSNIATGIRTLVVLVVVYLIVLFKGELKEWNNLTRHNVYFLIVAGVATGLSWVFYFKALQIGNVSQVAAVDKLSVAFVLVFSFVFLKEELNLKTLVGAALIIMGSLVIAVK